MFKSNGFNPANNFFGKVKINNDNEIIKLPIKPLNQSLVSINPLNSTQALNFQKKL